MKVKKSRLTFHRFVVLATLFEAIPFEDTEKEKTLPEIPLDVELDILINSEQKDLYNIVLEVSGNMGKKKKPGYSFSVTCEGIFSVKRQKKMKKEHVDQLLMFSAVPMVISSLRGYLLNMSSYALYGQYNLPAIDLQDLIEKKVAFQEREGFSPSEIEQEDTPESEGLEQVHAVDENPRA